MIIKMPLLQKKPAKAKKEPEVKTETLENTAFRTGMFGFKRTQVNLFINTLKKKIHVLEKEKEELIIENGKIGGSEKERFSDKYERQISDLSEKLNNEKNTSAMLEKECMRLQGEIENLNVKLVKKGGSIDVSNSADINMSKVYLNSSLSKKLNNIMDELNRIKSDFMTDESELIISVHGEQETSTFNNSHDFNEMKFEYTENDNNTSIHSEQIENSENAENDFLIQEFEEDIPPETGFEDIISEEAAEEKEVAIEIFAEEIKKTEVVPTTRLYDNSENSFDEVLINADKVENDDDFAGMLFSKANDYKVKGDDLIAENPEAKDYGVDLIAGNPASVDKGEDLNSDLYELYINDSNILIDDDDDGGKFYTGSYDENDYDDKSPTVSRLGFIGINEGSEPMKAFARSDRLKNIADDIGMSSSVDISDFLM